MRWKYWVPGVTSSCLITLGCLGNLLAIFILRKPKLRTAFNQLLISLCVIDTLVLLSNIPTTINSLGSRKFTLGQKSSSIYPKIHNFKVSFCTKFTFSKSYFSKNSHFLKFNFHKIHIFQTSNSW